MGLKEVGSPAGSKEKRKSFDPKDPFDGVKVIFNISFFDNVGLIGEPFSRLTKIFPIKEMMEANIDLEKSFSVSLTEMHDTLINTLKLLDLGIRKAKAQEAENLETDLVDDNQEIPSTPNLTN